MLSVEGESRTPAVLAVLITIMVALATLTPYVVKLPEENMNLIVQAQTTLWNGWLLALGYYFGTADKASRQTKTINAQADALAAVSKQSKDNG